MEVRVEWVAVLVSACFALIGAITYWRSGAWRREDGVKGEAAAQSKLAGDVAALWEKVEALPSAAMMVAQDVRLKAVEARVNDLPTGQQLTQLAGVVDVLKEKISGGFDTLRAEMRGAEDGRRGMQVKLDRIEQHLLTHGGA